MDHPSLRDVFMFGRHISRVNGCGNYMAELSAIFHAITAVPVGRLLTIESGARSAITVIEQYDKHTADRRRLRMPGRPVLALIHRAIHDKRSALPPGDTT